MHTIKWLPAAVLGFALLAFGLPAYASTPTQEDDPTEEETLERGEYLTTLAGCVDCHTPRTEEDEMIMDQALSGGRLFQLGELGTVLSPNITQDEETGIGAWTDEEIKVSIKTGISPGGYHNFPIMPYPAYNGMAETDIDAIVAYLRTVEPIENEIPREQVLPSEALPQIPYVEVESAPDASDPLLRGEYLIDHVFACGDCHHPIDSATGMLDTEQYLSGGQAFEGPWGTVYAANLTPHDETGLGEWSDGQIRAALQGGVRPDGRVLILMPAAEVYSAMNQDDLDAVVTYLQDGVEPIENEVPAPSLAEGFVVIEEVPEETEPEAATDGNNTLLIVGGVVLLIIVAGVGVIVGQRTAQPDDGG